MMKKIPAILVLFTAMLLFFSSCQNEETRMQLSRVDSIISTLAVAEKKLAEVNPDSISAKNDLYLEYSKKINNDYFKKDMNSREWQYMTLYHYVKKPFRNIASNHADYLRQIMENREQLNNLKHDIRKKMLTEEEIEKYIHDEKISVAVFLDKVSRQVERALKEEINFDTVHPRIVQMISTMEKIQQ